MTGIVVYPREWNKSQIVVHLKDNDEIVFLGNSYEKVKMIMRLLHIVK